MIQHAITNEGLGWRATLFKDGVPIAIVEHTSLMYVRRMVKQWSTTYH
jgi:hypothetical protein